MSMSLSNMCILMALCSRGASQFLSFDNIHIPDEIQIQRGIVYFTIEDR
jgi:hypothetical protein